VPFDGDPKTEEEMTMVLERKGVGALALRLIVGLALLACPRAGSAVGTWTVPSLAREPGEVNSPGAAAVDTAGNLYVAEDSWIQQRDAQGDWSVIATQGASALAVDAVGNLYVLESYPSFRIQKRDVQGNWSVIAIAGSGVGQVSSPSGLAIAEVGNLYVADTGNNRVMKYTPGP
jgi:hypothetical protein